MAIIYLVFLLVFGSLIYENDANKELKMVHLLYRHGARSPLYIYPKSKHKESYWPDGLGRLTQIGMKMEYELGIFLKERYVINSSFISRPYIPKQVYIRSSDSERCLQSAECQLAGLYPPSGHQIWKADLLWQPVPVHTVPKDADPVLRPHVAHCPRFVELRNNKLKTEKFRNFIAENENLFAIISNYTGMKIDADNLWTVVDQIICEMTNGLKIPKWADNIREKMKSVSSELFLDSYRGAEIGKLSGGPLLAIFNKNMKQFGKNGDIGSMFKMNIFSAHDTTLLALSSALDIDIPVPTFASCLMVELYYSHDTGYVVEMRYRANSTNVLHLVKLKKCKFSCPLDEFLKLTFERMSVDRNRECHISIQGFNSSLYKALLSTFVTLTILLLLLLMVIGLFHYKRSLLAPKFKGESKVLVRT